MDTALVSLTLKFLFRAGLKVNKCRHLSHGLLQYHVLIGSVSLLKEEIKLKLKLS